MPDINKILLLIYDLKKELLFTQDLLLSDPLKVSHEPVLKKAIDEIKKKKKIIDDAYFFIRKQFSEFQCPDEALRTEKITELLE